MNLALRFSSRLQLLCQAFLRPGGEPCPPSLGTDWGWGRPGTRRGGCHSRAKTGPALHLCWRRGRQQDIWTQTVSQAAFRICTREREMSTGIWRGSREPGFSTALEFKSWLWALILERGCLGPRGPHPTHMEPKPGAPPEAGGTDTAVVRVAQGCGRPTQWGLEETADRGGERGLLCASGTDWEAWAGPGSLPSQRQASKGRERHRLLTGFAPISPGPPGGAPPDQGW